MWWGQLFATALYLPLWWWEGAPWGEVSLWVLGITAGSSMLAYYGMSRAYRLGPLTLMVPVVSTWSAVAALLGVLVLGERPGAIQGLGALLTVMGGVANTLFQPSLPVEHPSSRTDVWRGIGWAAAASFGFGVLMLGVVQLTKSLGTGGVMPAVWGLQWLLFAPFWTNRGRMVRWPNGPGAIALMGALEALGFWFAALGVQMAPLALVGPASALSSVLTVVAMRVFFGEPVPAARWACVLVATLGLVLLALPSQ